MRRKDYITNARDIRKFKGKKKMITNTARVNRPVAVEGKVNPLLYPRGTYMGRKGGAPLPSSSNIRPIGNNDSVMAVPTCPQGQRPCKMRTSVDHPEHDAQGNMTGGYYWTCCSMTNQIGPGGDGRGSR